MPGSCGCPRTDRHRGKESWWPEADYIPRSGFGHYAVDLILTARDTGTATGGTGVLQERESPGCVSEGRTCVGPGPEPFGQVGARFETTRGEATLLNLQPWVSRGPRFGSRSLTARWTEDAI